MGKPLTDGDRSGTSGRTLVVIDMQPGFVAMASTLAAVLAEVRRAAALGQPIVIVRYDAPYAGEVDPRLLTVLRECGARFVTAVKLQEDGTAEVLEACAQAGFPTDVFEVCGVSTDCCVGLTAAGIADASPCSRVEVIKSACGCSDIRYDWSRFPSRANLLPT
jgi:nicotinamidase-related amidase